MYSVVIARVICAHVWLCACELPTASSHLGSTGVLWVLTGIHPCGPPPRQNGGGYQSASPCCGFVEWIVDCGERVGHWEDRVRIPTYSQRKKLNVVQVFKVCQKNWSCSSMERLLEFWKRVLKFCFRKNQNVEKCSQLSKFAKFSNVFAVFKNFNILFQVLKVVCCWMFKLCFKKTFECFDQRNFKNEDFSTRK